MDQWLWRERRRLSSLVGIVLLACWSLGAAEARSETNLPPAPLTRVAPRSLRLPSHSPDSAYSIQTALNGLRFTEPVAIVSPPGQSNQLFVVEKPGRIVVVTNLAAPTRSVFLDISDQVFTGDECGLVGLAFHPQYSSNGFFFVTYSYFSAGVPVFYFRVSRFRVSPSDPHRAQRDSELPLITQEDEHPWHIGGDLHFGPDGYLYISVGDEGASNNLFGNAQRIDRDFFSGLLRIDVDHRPGSLAPNPHPAASANYAIPPDNPFVGTLYFNDLLLDPTRLRSEFYAVGFRNPWRFCFDSATGDLFANDTGQVQREEIDLVRGGGNYGWAGHEGTLVHPSLLPLNAASLTFLPPIAEYAHDSGAGEAPAAIAGALLYRGAKFPSLDGSYVFSDYSSGKIGLLRLRNSESYARIRATRDALVPVTSILNSPSPDLAAAQAAWERGWQYQEPEWEILDPVSYVSAGGATLVKQSDGSLLVRGGQPWTDTSTVTALTLLTNLTAFRLEVLADASLPHRGPGRGPGGNFVLSEFEVFAAPVGASTREMFAPLTNATADFSQSGWNVSAAIDRGLDTGWAISPQEGRVHEAVFETVELTGVPGGTLLRFVLKQNYGDRVTLGRFRLSVSRTPRPPPASIARIVVRTTAQTRTEQESADVASYYRSIDPALRTVQARLARIEEELRKLPVNSGVDNFATNSGVVGRIETSPSPQRAGENAISVPNVPDNSVPLASSSTVSQIVGTASVELPELERLTLEKQRWQAVLASSTPKLAAAQAEWEERWNRFRGSWQRLEPLTAVSQAGAFLIPQPDSSILATGPTPWTDQYSVTARTAQTNITAIRLEVLPPENWMGGKLGRAEGGNVVLSELEVTAAPADNPNQIAPVSLVKASADFSQSGWDVSGAIDQSERTGWALAPLTTQAHQAIFETAQPIGFAGGTLLRIVLKQSFGNYITIGRFRLSVATQPMPPLSPVPLPELEEIIARPPEQRAAEESAKLSAFYREAYAPLRSLRAEEARLRDVELELLKQPLNLPIEWIALQTGIVSFGLDPSSGDILLADYNSGVLRKLIVRTSTPGVTAPVGFPAELADTGIFRDLRTLTPNPGVVPYSINVPFWSDGADKSRWFALPGTNTSIEFSPTEHWGFPTATVWVKHFEIELSKGVPESARRLETRVLTRTANGVQGVTYRWDASGTNAFLVGPDGASESLVIDDDGDFQTQVWRYPSRSECLQCHTAAAGYALGFGTVQLNREHDDGAATENQIRALNRAGFFSQPVTNFNRLLALAPADDASASLEFRVRSFLHANCSQCHQPGGGGRGFWDARITVPTHQTGLINTVPASGAADPADRILKPGSLEHSVLLRRLISNGADRMPPIATGLSNAGAIELVSAWIEQGLPDYGTYQDWQTKFFGSTLAPEGDALADPDQDGSVNYLEYLLGQNPLEPAPFGKLSVQLLNNLVRLHVERVPNRWYELQWTTDFGDPNSWQFLDVPANRPFFFSEANELNVLEPIPDSRTKFFRVVVRPP